MAGRFAIAGAVALLEYVAISFRFDSGGLRPGRWGELGQIGQLAKVGAIIAVASVMLSSRPNGHTSPQPLDKRALFAHVACFAAFWAITRIVFGDPEPPSGSPWVWFGVWAIVGASTVATLAAGVVGLRALRAQLAPRALLLGILIGTVAWLAGNFAQGLWGPRVAQATFELVTAMLRVAFQGVTSMPAERVVTLDDFSVLIHPACSGLEGIGLVTVLMIGYIAAFRAELRFPQALLLLPIAIVGVWLFNGARLASLLVVGARFSRAVAQGGFHAKAGWALFCAVGLGTAMLGRRSSYFSHETAASTRAPNPAAPFLIPIVAVMATSLVTGMFASKLDYLYGLRVIAGGLALYAYRNHYREWKVAKWQEPLIAGTVVGVAWLASAAPNPSGAAVISAAFASAPALSRLSWVVIRAAGSVFVIPACEELAFRGFLMRWLTNRNFSAVAIEKCSPLAMIVSSVAFGLVHDRWVAGFFAGVVFALVAGRRGLGAAVLAHAVANGMIAVWVLATSNYSHWL